MENINNNINNNDGNSNTNSNNQGLKITKLCKKCNLEKPAGEFRSNKKTKDKLFPYCIVCQNQVNKDLYEKKRGARLEQIKKWNNEHKDKLRKYKRNFDKRARRQKKIDKKKVNDTITNNTSNTNI